MTDIHVGYTDTCSNVTVKDIRVIYVAIFVTEYTDTRSNNNSCDVYGDIYYMHIMLNIQIHVVYVTVTDIHVIYVMNISQICMLNIQTHVMYVT